MIDPTALMFAGITPPTSGNRTICPKCSPKRRKSWERCMVITADYDCIRVYCHHCHYEEEIPT